MRHLKFRSIECTDWDAILFCKCKFPKVWVEILGIFIIEETYMTSLLCALLPWQWERIYRECLQA